MNPITARLFVAIVAAVAMVNVAQSRMVLKNICRVKGQDEVTLRGLGLVVGLKGTGDGGDTLPTIRALAKAMEVMGMPLSAPTGRGQGGLKELKDAKNVALVMVTATVPATGSQRGDRIDCLVNAIGAKSLSGGRLFVTPLLGPDVRDRRVYAMVEGQIELDDLQRAPTAGRISRGCRLEADFSNDHFIQDGKITLVLDKDYADFQVAAEIADLINTQILNSRLSESSADGSRQARAVDQVRIEVPVPPAYLADNTKNRSADVVAFISEMMSMQVPEPPVDARVVINQRTGSIVVSGDVELGASVVTHKNFVIEAGQTMPKFVAVDTEDRALTPEERAKKPPTTKLKSLLEALNAVKAKPEDMIEIIKGLKRNGKLHAHVIFEQGTLQRSQCYDYFANLRRYAAIGRDSAHGRHAVNGYEGAGAVDAQHDPKKVRETFDTFVGETFYGQMLKALRSTVDKPAYFHGGRAEEVFQAQFDQVVAQQLAKANAGSFTGPMFDQFIRQLDVRG